jgi:hypothetical protein
MAKIHLEKLKMYCPTGTAEGERAIRNEIFVQTTKFSDLIVPPPGSPILLVGKKGTGKSILIDFSMDLFRAKGVPTVKLRPKDLSLDAIPEGSSSAHSHAYAYAVLIRAVAAELGSTLTGLLSSAENSLREEAIQSGVTRPDLISQLAKFLPRVADKIADTDIASLLPSENKASINYLEKSLKEALSLKGTNKALFVFIDDTDQVASPDRPGQLNRLWGLLLACRDLCELSNEIRCIVTLREEVWTRISNDKAGQRDQTDHFITLVRNLDPTPEGLKLIVRRRLERAMAASKEPKFKEKYSIIFDGHRPHMPGSDDLTSWEDLIVTRSRGRPRDAIQFLNLLATAALDAESRQIGDTHVSSVIQNFSTSRSDLLAQENELECPQLKDILKTFSARELYDSGSFKMSTKTALAHLKTIPSRFSTQLFGQTLKQESQDDCLFLLKFLFRIGFLNARVARPSGVYLHIDPTAKPNIVSPSTINDLQLITWEVHPVYRDFLINEQQTLIRKS